MIDSKREWRYSNKLVVNEKNKVRYYSYKSEEEGIKDLFDLIPSANREECYAFIHDQNKWIEVGYKEETLVWDGAIISDGVEVNHVLLDSLASTNKSVYLWHIHRLEEKVGRSRQSISTPSSSDMEHFVDWVSRAQKSNPNFDEKDGVISRFGKISYTLNGFSNHSVPDNASPSVASSIYGKRWGIFLTELENLRENLECENPLLNNVFERDILKGEVTIKFVPIKR